MKQNYNLDDVCRILEIPKAVFNLPQNMPIPKAEKKLKELKEFLGKQRKHLAKKYHPDVNKDSAALEKIQEINTLIDFLLKNLKIKVERPKPVNHIIIRTYNGNWMYSNSTNSTTSGSTY